MNAWLTILLNEMALGTLVSVSCSSQSNAGRKEQ